MRMPPIGSNEIDPVGTDLIRRWIGEELTAYQNYEEWQESQFGELKDSIGGAGDDPDEDGDKNEREFLNRTDPLSGNEFGRMHVMQGDGFLKLRFGAGPFTDYQVETSHDLSNWSPLSDRAGRPLTLPEGESMIELILGPANQADSGQFFRVQAEER
jgi:hypothetical protein